MTTVDDIRGAERLDSRDLIELGNELASRLEDGDELDDDEREALEAINELAGEGIEDWEYGAFFVREDAFEDYAQELAEDIGAIDRDAAWPLTYIDWEAAARALAMDFTSVSFLGHDYYVR